MDEKALGYALVEEDLITLGRKAQEARFFHHPEPVVTYVHDANPNYTNVCITYCSFCAFMRKPKDPDAYTHTPDAMVEKLKPLVQLGIDRILMQGGHNPFLPLDYYIQLIQKIRTAYPHLELHLFSAPEIQAIAKFNKCSTKEVLKAFYQAGLRTLPGGGAEILSDKVRKQISPLKGTSQDWLQVHREAHRIGYRTTATMMYGHVEGVEDVVEHFRVLRALQDETGGFIAFIPWSFKPGNTSLASQPLTPAFRKPLSYLRILAAARLYLDNFPHIQSSWFSEGKRLGQLGLSFGADDFGGTLMEEHVLDEADHRVTTTVEEVERLIQEAGFIPKRRKTLY